MITTVKTRKKIPKDQDPDRGLGQTRKREKSPVRKNAIRGKVDLKPIENSSSKTPHRKLLIQKLPLKIHQNALIKNTRFKIILAAPDRDPRQKSDRVLGRRMIKSLRLENVQNLMIDLNRK